MTLKVFSQGPFFDDYDETKGFYRILFKPGVAVQARELTQLQTILQKQIERHGSSIFDEGSMVLGGKTSFDFSLQFLRISNALLNSATIDVLVSQMLIGVTSTATAKVISYTQETSRPGTWTLLVKTFSDIPFVSGEILKYQPDPTVAGTNEATLISTAYDFQGKASVFSIQQGVFYTRGNFVYCAQQTVPISFDIYNGGGTVIFDGSKPSARLGLSIVESQVDSDTDSTLLDNSLGSFNYNAPGADRYSIILNLVSKVLLKQAQASVNVDTGSGQLTTFNIGDGGAGYPTINFNTIPVTITGGTGGTAIVAGVDANSGAITSIVRTAAGSGYAPSTTNVTVAAPTEVDDTFIELARFELGTLLKDVTHPIYSVIGDTMARRTSDESGDYSLNPFLVRLSTSGLGDNYFTANVDMGKAYVKGYEFTFVSPTQIDVARARDASHQIAINNYNINTYFGNYVVIVGSSVTKPFDPTGFPLLNLLSSGTQIGVARLAQITSAGVDDQYQFHLSDVNITDVTKNFSNVDKIELNSDITTYCTVTGPNAVLLAPSAAALLHVLPNVNTKTIGGSLSYTYWITKTGTTDGGGNLTLTQTGGVQFKPVSTAALDMETSYIVYDTTSGGILPLSGGVTISAAGINPAVALFTGLPATHNVTVLALVENPAVPMKTKTLNNGTATGLYTENHTVVSADIANKYITLNNWDGLTLIKVTTGADDITSRFSFDTGQRDGSYQYARLMLNAGQVMPVATSVLVVTYDYLFHGATGDFFCVDSYPDYDTIPAYITKDGTTLALENVLDFRPNADTTNSPVLPYINTDILLNYTYYVGRIDRLILTQQGEFKTLTGVPSLTPQPPKPDKSSMSTAFLKIAPYTKTPSSDVKVTQIDNKRYTMRDIGTLDARIGRLEYYNELSLLEKKAKDLSILDSSGLDRFKNGALVDAFQGYSVADVNNPDLACGIDIGENFMTCQTAIGSLTTKPVYSTRTNVAIGDQMLTLAFTTLPVITQGQASASMSVNPFNVTAFNGKLLTNPVADIWTDVTHAPGVIENSIGQNDIHTAPVTNSLLKYAKDPAYHFYVGSITLKEKDQAALDATNGIATTFGAWSSNYDGRYGAIPPAAWWEGGVASHDHNNNMGPWLNADGTRTTVSRTVTKTSPIFGISTKSVGEVVVNTSLIPLMRNVDIIWAASGMKPNTRVYPFFDNTDITKFITRCDVLNITTYSGGKTVPTITAFDYSDYPTVTQNVPAGIATGRVVLCRNGQIHIDRDPRSPSFQVTGGGSSPGPLELLWTKTLPSGLQVNYNSNYTINLISLASRQWLLSDGSTMAFTLQHTVSSPFTFADLVVRKNGVDLVHTTDWTIDGGGTTITMVVAPLTTDRVYVSYPWTVRTDNSGFLSGLFQVPGQTYYVGARVLRFIDVSTNIVANAATYADYTFSSEGLKETVEDNVVTTRVQTGVKTEKYTETIPLWADPLAESFLIDTSVHPNGIFLDSVNLCFRNKDPALPVSIEIRPMVNGFPHSSMHVPGSVISVDASNVNITNLTGLDPLPGIGFTIDGELVPSFSDPRTITNFKFLSPLYLKPGEYALIVESNSNLYETFVAKIGATQLGSGAAISSQPYNGSLFLSQNSSTWTPDQTSDLMFQLNRCDFVSSGSTQVIPKDYNNAVPFDYDLLWATANNIEFDGIANVGYGIKTTDPVTNLLDVDYLPFVMKENIYFTSRRRLTTNSTLVAATTGQTVYQVPFLNMELDDIDILLTDPTDGSLEVVQNKALYILRPKVAAPLGTTEIVWQSAIKPAPLTGTTMRFVQNNTAEVLLSLATTDSKVSPLIDLSQFTLRFIQNRINAGGVDVTTFVLPDVTVGANLTLFTPTITLANGTGGVLYCETQGGALTNIIINTPGTGYLTTSATVSTSSGVTATVALIVDGGGAITGFTITNTGSGYPQTTLSITSTTGSGAAVIPIVTQQSAGASHGMVTGWNVESAGQLYTDNFTATLVRNDATTVPVIVFNECSASGGNALTRYISRKVTLLDGFDAKDISVYLTAMKPQGATVDVYYKVEAAADNTDWSATPYVQMTKVGDVQSLDFNDYKEMQFKTVGNVAYNGFTTYKTFAIKIVLTAINTAYAPRIHDLRGMALATTY